MDPLKFRALLFMLSLILRWGLFRHPDLRARRAETDTIIRIQAQGVGRTFALVRGRLSRKPHAPVAVLDWTHASKAVAVMTSGYDGEMMKAFQNEEVSIQGNAREIFAFFSIIKEIKDLSRA